MNDHFLPTFSLIFSIITANPTADWTHTTGRRLGGLRAKCPKYDVVAKTHFNRASAQTRVMNLTNGVFCASFVWVSGDPSSNLTRKLRTLFASVLSTMEDESDTNAEATSIVLGSTSNRVDILQPSFILSDTVGKTHAVLEIAAKVPTERRKDFPHGPVFKAAQAPKLAPHLDGTNADIEYIISYPPVAFPVRHGVDDVATGKCTDQTIQNFGDTHEVRGQRWLNAELAYDQQTMQTILDNKDELAPYLPTMGANKLFNGRLVATARSDDNEDSLELAIQTLEARIHEQVAQSVPNNITTNRDDVTLGLDTGNASPSGDPDTKLSVERKKKAERMAIVQLLFAHVDKHGKVRPPEFSDSGKILFDILEKQESNRACNEALVAAIQAAKEPSRTHYLGRASRLGEGGLTDYMIAGFNQFHFKKKPLPSIQHSSKSLDGFNIAMLIPPRKRREGDPEDNADNNELITQMMMGEVSENLTSMSRKCIVNPHFGSYMDIMGFLGNLFLLQDVFFKSDQASEIRQWATLVGDCVTNSEVQLFIFAGEEKSPKVAFALLNAAEQMFLHLTGNCRKRIEMAKAVAKNWDGVKPEPYKDAGDTAIAICTKLVDASKGGDAMTGCRMFENSLFMAAQKRVADKRRADELMSLTKAARRGRGGDDDDDRESKKAKRITDREERRRVDGKTLQATDADKTGGIVCGGYFNPPRYTSGKQPCGAGHRQGVACSKFLHAKKCERCHIAIDALPDEKKEIWRKHVNNTPGLSFNTVVVTCFKKVGDNWINA